MKGFVIRINNHPLSEKLAAEAYDSCKKFDIDVEYFDAVVPNTLGSFFHEYGVKMSDEFLVKKSNELFTQACFASHYCLWNRCVQLDEKIIILEHDGVILKKLNEIYAQVDDVCHLDPNRPYSKNYDEKLLKPQADGIVDFGDSNKWTSDRTFTGQHFAGTYAYIISPSGANKVINFVKTYGAWESDRLLGKNVLRLQITRGSYARLNKIFKTKEDIKKYSTRT